MSTKINVRSPFYKKYSATNLRYVDLTVYVYSGTKTTDKGTAKYKLRKYPTGTNNYVIFQLSEIIRDYIKPESTTPLNDNINYVKWVQVEDETVPNFVPDSSDITGFAVAQNGTVTFPTSASGSQTINSINFLDTAVSYTGTTLPSYAANTSGSPITRTARVNIKIPSGFFASLDQNALVIVTTDQPSS